jgi:hypothetical protein
MRAWILGWLAETYGNLTYSVLLVATVLPQWQIPCYWGKLAVYHSPSTPYSFASFGVGFTAAFAVAMASWDHSTPG